MQGGFLVYRGNSSQGFSKKRLLDTWNRAMEFGRIGPYEIYPNGSSLTITIDVSVNNKLAIIYF